MSQSVQNPFRNDLNMTINTPFATEIADLEVKNISFK